FPGRSELELLVDIRLSYSGQQLVEPIARDLWHNDDAAFDKRKIYNRTAVDAGLGSKSLGDFARQGYFPISGLPFSSKCPGLACPRSIPPFWEAAPTETMASLDLFFLRMRALCTSYDLLMKVS